MDNMKIGGSLGIFKKNAAPKSDNKVSNNPFSTNPFGLSFKGKNLEGDLFQKTESVGKFKATILEKGKMAVSAAVGSLTHIKNTFKEKADKAFGPIIVFAKKTSEKVSQIADSVNNFKASDLKISNLIKPDPYPNMSKQSRKLLDKYKDNVEGLGALLEASIAHA